MKQYHELLIGSLEDPVEAANYLNAVLAENDEKLFLVALRNVAEAQGGMLKLAKTLKLNRSNLYRIFSKNGNPEIKTLSKILTYFGLKLTVVADPKKHLRAA